MATKVKKTEDRLDKELDKLLENRRFRFREILGKNWPSDDIEQLARNYEIYPADFSKQFKKLTDSGCSPELAIKIIL